LLAALLWPQILYPLAGLADPQRFTQARFQRSARLARRVFRIAMGFLGGAFLAHAWAWRWPAPWDLWVQGGLFGAAWLGVLATLGITLWHARPR